MKFANVTPSLDSCQRVLDAAERIVRTTMPRARPAYTGDGPIPPAGGARASDSASASGFPERGPPAMNRWVRGFFVGFASLGVLFLACAYPILARGEAWVHAQWGFPWVLAALALVPLVVWKTTLGQDGRVPRLGLSTLTALMTGPRGWRSRFRDLPGDPARGGAACSASPRSHGPRTSSGVRTPRSAASTSSSSSTCRDRCGP